ncbi:MAG: hypothetical protein JW860_01570 [Sedimentisphaerales bacterium]|nr:hypothetical protein [Sedimentisphaerales bacterium]
MKVFQHNHLEDYEDAISQFRLEVGERLVNKYFLFLGAIWGFIWGAVVLTCRWLDLVEAKQLLLYGLAGLSQVLIASVLLARKKLPSRTAVRALIDHQSRCGGMFMAAAETGIGSWQETLPKLNPVQISWRGGRIWGLFAMAVIFVLIAFLVPQRFVQLGLNNPLEIGSEIDQLNEQIRMLTQEKVIDPQRGLTLMENLNTIQAEAKGLDPMKTWEALDHVREDIAKTAQEAAQSALSQTEQLSRVQTLAEAMLEGKESLDSQMMSEAMSSMAAMMQKALEKNQNLLQNDMLKGILNSLDLEDLANSLSQEDLLKICQALKLDKEMLQKMMAQLSQADLIDLKKLKLCEKLGQCNGKELADFLAREGMCMSMSELASMFSCGNCPGGGIDRGPGDAAMTWSEGSPEENAAFKEQALPAASLEDLKDSSTVGVSVGDPTEEHPTLATGSGALAGAATDGGSAYTQVILPRHRSTVKNYFERE